MGLELIKSIFLVLLGGFITFVITLITGRIQRRDPNIEWRKFPDLQIASEGLTGISWLIENNGRKSAKNVRVTFQLPETAQFQSFEVEASESALKLDVTEEQGQPSKSIVIPIFTQNVAIGVSCLVSNLLNRDIAVSIVGEDIVGTKTKEITKDYQKERFKSFRKVYWVVNSFLFLFMAFFIIFFGFLMHGRMQLANTESIVALFIKHKDFDGAISMYDTFRKNNILFRNSSSVYFRLAQIYGYKNDTKNCLKFLKKTIGKIDEGKFYKNLIETDSALII